MKHQPPLLTETRVEAYVASALRFVFWLFGVILRHGFCGRSKKLDDTLRFAERAVELTLFVRAVARYGPLPRRKPRPSSIPPGSRLSVARHKLFYKRANIRARKSSPIARVFALIEALHDPERAIAYFLKRIRKGLRGRHIVIAAPIADARVCIAAPAPLAPDSS